MDEQIAAVARHGIVDARQLERLGETREGIKYRLEVGRLHRVFRNAYAVGHGDITLSARYLAAVRSVGPDTVAGRYAAGVVWAMVQPRDEEELRPVAVIAPRKVRAQPGLEPHIGFLHPRDVTVHHGVPVTTPARTLLDLAATLSEFELMRALRQAEVYRRVSHPQLRALLARHRGHRGAAKLRALVVDGPAPTRSPLEDAFLRRVGGLGLERPRMNARVHGWEVDFHWPDLELVVETDGARWHDTPTARLLDAIKQERLERAGLRVERVRWHEVRGWRPPSAVTPARSGTCPLRAGRCRRV